MMRDKSASLCTSLTTLAALDSPCAYAALMRWINMSGAIFSIALCAGFTALKAYFRIISAIAERGVASECQSVRPFSSLSNKAWLLRAKV